MRAYGLPRDPNVEFPDCGDLQTFALKPSRGILPGPGGDRHSGTRSTARKNAARRYWKRAARREGKAAIAESLAE